MPLETRDIAKALPKKGFRVDDSRDHHYYWLYIGEIKQAVKTKLSHGSNHRTISDSLVAMMARELQLKRRDFELLVDCTMDGDEYLETLREKKVQLTEVKEEPRPQKAAKPKK